MLDLVFVCSAVHHQKINTFLLFWRKFTIFTLRAESKWNELQNFEMASAG